MIRFQNPNHTRIFVIFMTTLGVGTYFSPTLYRMFYLPRKLARERQERDAAELAQVAAGMWFLADYSSSLFSHSSEVDDEVGLNSCLSIKDWLKLVKSLKLCPQSWSRVCLFFNLFFKREFVDGSVLRLANGLDCQSSGQGFDPWAQQAEGLFASTSKNLSQRCRLVGACLAFMYSARTRCKTIAHIEEPITCQYFNKSLFSYLVIRR